MQKCQLPELLEPPSFTGCNPKLKKSSSRLLLYLLNGFQNGMSQPRGTKTHKEDRIPGNGLLADQEPGVGPLGVRSPTQDNFCCVLTVIFFQDSIFQSKFIQLIHTNRHTFCIVYVGGDKLFVQMEIYTFSLD